MKKRHQAFDHDLVALLPRLQRFALVLTGKLDACDDLVQATIERALSRCQQWTPGTRLDSWAFSMMDSVWKNELRAQRVRRGAGTIHPELYLVEDGERQIEGRLVLREIKDAVMQLPEEQRMLFLLVYVEGKCYQEAAEIVGVPIGTVMSRLARARRRLGRTLGGLDLGAVKRKTGAH